MTGIALGLLAYGGVVLMAVAGFTTVLPLVVVPPVLVGLIGASNLLGGGRTHGRSTGRPTGYGRAPLSSSGPNGPLPGDSDDPDATPGAASGSVGSDLTGGPASSGEVP
jgi:hypothetical protein